MKRLTGLLSITVVLFAFGLLVSCKSLAPSPLSSEQPLKSATPAPLPPEPPSTIKPVDPPNIWWGPKPDTAENFMTDMKTYYPDWYEWFTDHPEDIKNYFPLATQSEGK